MTGLGGDYGDNLSTTEGGPDIVAMDHQVMGCGKIKRLTCCNSMPKRAPMQEIGHSSARAFLAPVAAAILPLTSFHTASPVGSCP